MSVFLDLLGSVVIASFVLVIGLQLNDNIVGSRDASFANLNAQESLVDIVSNIESDLRKSGFGLYDPASSIALAQPEHVRFRSDIDRNLATGLNGIDSVDWYLGPLVHGFPNDSIRVLYRQVNGGTPVGAALGVTKFKLRYLDQDGSQTAVLTQIRMIEVTLQVESPYKVQDQVRRDQPYEDMQPAVAFWRQTRLSSRNISRR